MEQQQEEQTILLDKEIFILHKAPHEKQAIYFGDETLKLEFIDYELLTKNETVEYYSFSLIFSEKGNGNLYTTRDPYLKVTYSKSLTSTIIQKVSYNLCAYLPYKLYGRVTIMDIKEDTNDFILYLTIHDDKDKPFFVKLK